MATTKTATKKKTTAQKTKTSNSNGKKPAKKRVTENQIRSRAEEIYLTRMKTGIPGDADSDWIQAERELVGSN